MQVAFHAVFRTKGPVVVKKSDFVGLDHGEEPYSCCHYYNASGASFAPGMTSTVSGVHLIKTHLFVFIRTK